MRRDPAARDAGVMTTWAAIACAALLIAFVGLAHIGAAVVARHRAQSAADLAALAAATALRDGFTPCDAGGELADRNGAVLAECREAGSGDVYIEVEVQVLSASATARARAGPWEGHAG